MPDEHSPNANVDLTRVFSESDVQKHLFFCLLVGVCGIVLLVHLPALSSKAHLYDDQMYVTKNPLVQNPSWRSAGRFFTEVWKPSTVPGYYHPLAMVSLMLDRFLAGPRESMRVYHRTSLLLHIANTALLAAFLYLLFPQPVAVAAGALLFGLHPISVDSICWLSERKTVLATFFALLSLIAYVKFTREHKRRHLIGCVAAYVLALLSKPIALPLPFMMVLLDYWPLERFYLQNFKDKLPLFGVAGVFTVIGYISQRHASWIQLPGQYNPLEAPLVLCDNAIFYLCKFLWPVNLSAHYEPAGPIDPFNPSTIRNVILVGAMLLLLLLSLRWTRAVFTCSMIAFVLLFPAGGIVSHTIVRVANRYFYFPSIGLVLLVAWLLARLLAVNRTYRLQWHYFGVAVAITLVAGAEGIVTRQYMHHWTTTVDLYGYMVSMFPRSSILHNDMALALRQRGNRKEAVEHLQHAVREDPRSCRAHYNLGLVLSELSGHTEDAIRHYRKAVQFCPDFVNCRLGLAGILFRTGNQCEGLANLRKAAEIVPDSAVVQHIYGTMLMVADQPEDALLHLRNAIEIFPGLVPAMKDLAWFLATHPDKNIRSPDEAVRIAERARTLTRDRNVEVLDTLAAAYASAGRWKEATETARQGLAMTHSLGRRETAMQIEERLHLYEAGRPYYEEPRMQLGRLLAEANKKLESGGQMTEDRGLTTDNQQLETEDSLQEVSDEAETMVAE